jgi:putative transcription factor
MRCEVCGRKIIGPPFKAMIEGAKMMVCSNCARLGAVYWEAKTEPKLKKVARRLPQPVLAPRKQPPISVAETLELVVNFGGKVRQAREKMGLSHGDLGKKISEKVSVLRKIESGKMTPDNILVEKLQHALRIKLLVPVTEPKVPSKTLAAKPVTATLGEIAQVRKERG